MKSFFQKKFQKGSNLFDEHDDIYIRQNQSPHTPRTAEVSKGFEPESVVTVNR